MAKEVQFKFDLGDIHAYSLVCTKCQAEVTVALDSNEPLPQRCTMCDEQWTFHNAIPKAAAFISALRQVHQGPDQTAKVRLVFALGEGWRSSKKPLRSPQSPVS